MISAESLAAGRNRVLRTFQHRNFQIYVCGNSVSLIGTWMQRVAVGWLAWELTHSGLWLGLVACADLLPTVVVGPFGGVLADRYETRRIMMAAQAFAFCQAVTLVVFALADWLTVEALAVLVLLNGFATGFYQPARLTLTYSLVPRADLATAIAINSIVFNLARFIGPAVAGVLILTVGVQGAFAVNALSFLALILALSCLKIEARAMTSVGSGRTSMLAELGDGLRYTLRHPGIGPMLLLLAVASLGLRPFVELLPGFAAEIFAGGAETLALLSSSVGAGAIVSGALIAQMDSRHLTRRVLLANLLLIVAIGIFAVSTTLWLAVASVVLAGMAMVASGVAMQTLMQTAVDDVMRGRVLSLYGIIFVGGPAAGALLLGSLSEIVGFRLPLIAGVTLVTGYWVWAWRQRARIEAALEADG